MSRVTERMRQNNKKSTFVLQLTAMVDMFTILLVFLLKSYSTSAVNITPSEGLNLPFSTSQEAPIEALKLVVAQDGVFVGDQRVIDFKDGQVLNEDMSKDDPDFLTKLYAYLEKEATKTQEIAARNQAIQFTGRILMQADENLSYVTLKKVMYTASLAGYTDLKMATIGE